MEEESQFNGDTASKREAFMPQETLGNPFDVTLVVEDGKEFKAHRDVLSEASPFFRVYIHSHIM